MTPGDRGDGGGVISPDLSDIGRVWLVGCGNMGGALLRRWRDCGLADVVVVDPRSGQAELPADGSPDVVVLAVKPQVWLDATAELRSRLRPGALVVSVMAGIGTAALGARFPGASIVRTVPNTPAGIGRGITALFAASADASARDTAAALMAAAGEIVWLDREADFDAVTAVSGSGPAYVFAFIEALAAAAEAAGLAADLAARLAHVTVAGAAALADGSSETPAALRVAVTSPNGTTAAGLDVLQPALGPLLHETVAAAQSRSRQLGRPV